MGCGYRDENNDICGETYTCPRCRQESKYRDILEAAGKMEKALVEAREWLWADDPDAKSARDAIDDALKAYRTAVGGKE